MATDFVQKWSKLPTPLHLSLCHSETEWAIVFLCNFMALCKRLTCPAVANEPTTDMLFLSSTSWFYTLSVSCTINDEMMKFRGCCSRTVKQPWCRFLLSESSCNRENAAHSVPDGHSTHPRCGFSALTSMHTRISWSQYGRRHQAMLQSVRPFVRLSVSFARLLHHLHGMPASNCCWQGIRIF